MPIQSEADPRARPPRGRRPSHAPSGREALLVAARRSFARKGFDGASLRDIAAQAGVDVALVARLFGSKDALWRAVIDDLAAAGEHYRAQFDHLAAGGDARGGFCEFIVLFSRISLEIPEFPALLMQETCTPGPRLESIERLLVEPFLAAAAPIVRAAIDQGVLRATDPALCLRMLLPAIALPLLGAAMSTDRAAAQGLADELARQALQMLLVPAGARQSPP
ncbi:TetR/AcrR family transcriptional regulator [Rubrivivax gelatinosus]|uniref:TetR family transcriptional regulator n=1 Tax=Rubrivivax gelatinosus TaxID=28068 RepID=A0A4R2LSL6_RUBGE|nr:TetR/AcrR family transcriptional regulator [Rubrivivax gelatinosus]TCO97378.1 TetR family transcriptional regulator [Rubrivivax gelatinosus]